MIYIYIYILYQKIFPAISYQVPVVFFSRPSGLLSGPPKAINNYRDWGCVQSIKMVMTWDVGCFSYLNQNYHDVL